MKKQSPIGRVFGLTYGSLGAIVLLSLLSLNIESPCRYGNNYGCNLVALKHRQIPLKAALPAYIGNRRSYHDWLSHY